MAANHIDIHVPHFPAWHYIMVHLSESECVGHARDCGFSSDSGLSVSHFFLGFHHTNHQTFSDFESLQWMRKWFHSRIIYHGVSSVEEFRDISADVPVEHELATGVKPLISIQIKD